jgi:hypothetical protein
MALPIHPGGARAPTRAPCSALACAFLLCANAGFWSMQPGQRAISISTGARASDPTVPPAYTLERVRRLRARGANEIYISKARKQAETILPQYSTPRSTQRPPPSRIDRNATGEHIPTDAALNFSAGRPRGSSAPALCATVHRVEVYTFYLK